MRLPYLEFVLKKALKGTEIVFVLAVFVLTRLYCIVYWHRQTNVPIFTGL